MRSGVLGARRVPWSRCGRSAVSAKREVKLSSGYRVRIDDGFSGEALTRLLDVLEVRR
jgi:hypothetical protein